MAYLPKSKYKILQTSGEKYVDPLTGAPYSGPYILTSEGAYKGNDITKPLLPLTLPATSLKNSRIYPYKNTKEYDLANKFVSNTTVGNFKPIIATKTKPTDQDYKRGYYYRYFCKRNNSNNIFFEINKKTFETLENGRIYDYILYDAGYLKWAIDGNIIKANSSILQQKEREFPNISTLFPKLNEFQKIRKTQGGELRYLDGREYIGYYHVHQNKPMVGLFHRQESHETLENIDISKSISLSGGTPTESTIQNMGYSAPENVQNQISTPSTPSTGGGSSGGGGGGY